VVPVLASDGDRLSICVADKWGFTPLHEAAQKGRTQLCALLLAHGADPGLKNQEGQTPLDLASADDVKCLLQVPEYYFSHYTGLRKLHSIMPF
jgi:hypothetical protein